MFIVEVTASWLKQPLYLDAKESDVFVKWTFQGFNRDPNKVRVYVNRRDACSLANHATQNGWMHMANFTAVEAHLKLNTSK